MSSVRNHSEIKTGANSVPSAWVLPCLMLALIALSGLSITLGWDGANSWRFTLIAVLAGGTAALFARTRIYDGFAILVAIGGGILAVWAVTALWGNHFGGSVWSQLKSYPSPVIEALVHDQINNSNRDLTAETLLSITIWMSSWIAMWMLLRVGYVILALIPPVVLILANAHFADGQSTWLPVVMIAFCLMIIVRQQLESHSRRWQSRRVDVSDSVFGRVLITGLALAVMVSSTILATPSAWSESFLQPLVERTVDRLEEFRLEAQQLFDSVMGTSTAPPQAGSYTDFSDGYSVGGPLSLTDEPEVLVQSETANAPYLKARTYDNYTGRGWTSSTSGTFAESDDSERTSPELRYNPNWEVALSPDARAAREQTTLSVTPLSPNSNVVLSAESFLSADVQTVVRMSWTDVSDLPLNLTMSTLNQLPPDVQRVGSLLLQSELTGDTTAWGPSATSGNLQVAIDEEVDNLARRGIQVRWTATSDGIVDTLFVTGRLPVFDDVEAVFQYQTASETDPTYSVTGLSSIATSDELMNAGTEYPTWVTDRYLQTGDTVTDRTLQLTHEIIGDETNPYLQSVLIEDWLRTNITYDETVDAPPGDQDLVDYVLFDYRSGYCEHYSAAMVVMLRSLGVPARVAVGYSPGTWDEATGSFMYLQRNAHAWVEVYFPGYGWIPFEPTANRPLGEFDLESSDVGGEELTPQAPEDVPTEEPAPTSSVSTPNVESDNSAATPQPTSSDESEQPPVVLQTDESGGPPGWLIGGLISVGVIGVIGGGLWLLWNWSLRGLSPAAGLMKRMQRVGGWMGIRTRPTTTPREFSRRMGASAEGLSRPIKRITRAYEIETFGPSKARDSIVEDARHAWGEIRNNIIRLIRRREK